MLTVAVVRLTPDFFLGIWQAAGVELTHASYIIFVDDNVVGLNVSCFGSKQLNLSLVLGFLG